jgi:hypothetical protein
MFLAFLIEYLGARYLVQSLMRGSVFVAIAAVTDTAYAMAAGALAPVLSRARGVRALGRYVPGGVLHRPRRLHGGP